MIQGSPVDPKSFVQENQDNSNADGLRQFIGWNDDAPLALKVELKSILDDSSYTVSDSHPLKWETQFRQNQVLARQWILRTVSDAQNDRWGEILDPLENLVGNRVLKAALDVYMHSKWGRHMTQPVGISVNDQKALLGERLELSDPAFRSTYQYYLLSACQQLIRQKKSWPVCTGFALSLRLAAVAVFGLPCVHDIFYLLGVNFESLGWEKIVNQTYFWMRGAYDEYDETSLEHKIKNGPPWVKWQLEAALTHPYGKGSAVFNKPVPHLEPITGLVDRLVEGGVIPEDRSLLIKTLLPSTSFVMTRQLGRDPNRVHLHRTLAAALSGNKKPLSFMQRNRGMSR